MNVHIRESARSRKAWIPFCGICLLGVLAVGLDLEGSSLPADRPVERRAEGRDATLNKSSFDADVIMATTPRAVRNDRLSALQSGATVGISTIPQEKYPIGPTYVVDPYNDIGNQWRAETGNTGPIPLRPQLALDPDVGFVATGGVGGGCSFAIDCDDGDPCTIDRCDIAPGGAAGTGVCVNDPVQNGETGDCSDGVFCNGEETCEGGDVFLCQGTCAGGPNVGQPCETSAANVGCPDSVCVGQVCQGGPNDTQSCEYHQDCTITLGTCQSGGNPCPGDDDPVEATACNEFTQSCQEPCTVDGDCTDDLNCNGVETCGSQPQFGGGSAFVCVPGTPPCGPNANCREFRCLGCGSGCNGRPCASDLDCVGGNDEQGTCSQTNPPTTGCFPGRCCDGDSCTPSTFVNCAFDWYPGDNGQIASGFVCADSDGPVPCPVYSAGIGDLGEFTVVAGPASLSPANNIMSGAPIRKLGDDYDFTGAGVGSQDHLALSKFRFVGGVSTIGNSRISFEFYDEFGNFVEDLFFISALNTVSVQLVLFDPPLIIPPKGFVVAHVLQQFGNVTDRGEMFWVATDEVDAGTNDTSVLYVVEGDLDDPPMAVTNFLKRCVGGLQHGAQCGVGADCDSGVCESRSTDVLAFELTGQLVSAPLGACCGENLGECEEVTLWECRGSGGTFSLDGECASCGGGSPLLGAPCRTCNGGSNDGAPCGRQEDCPDGGTCEGNDLACQVCDGGTHDGEPCNEFDCTEGGGTCGGVGTCEVTSFCNTGACCLEDGLCVDGETEASCVAAPGVFQGFGTSCDPNCCRQPEYKWTGADNCEDAIVNVINVECQTDADCGGVFMGSPAGRCDTSSNTCVVTITGDNSGASSTPQICLGGTTPGKTCFDDTDCEGGGTCAINVCVGGSNDGGACSSGADCPAACEGGSNAGNECADDVDCPGGKCGPAGICQGNPDSCNPPNPVAGAELGYWQAFSIDDCAFVRLDHCCSDPVKIPAYRVLYNSCPCGQAVFTKRDPNVPAEPPDARGAPYCAENNAWNKFGPLPAGTYYYPVLSFLGGNFEEYQLHITTKPCPAAACCYNACSDSSNADCSVTPCADPDERCVRNRSADSFTCKRPCAVDEDCGGVCEPLCDIMNVLECDALGGAFLAPPNRAEGVTQCLDICETGSCCIGPGDCVDEETGVGDTITKPECDALEGNYVGGFRCFGGTCDGGSRDGLSCALDDQCPGGGICTGDDQDLAQPSPCPVCQIIGGDNCQLFNDGVGSRDSDLSISGGASRQADDFVPQGNQVSAICFWGSYAKIVDSNAVDCSEEVGDNFVVTIYTADPVTGLPDNGSAIERVIDPNDLFRAEQVPSTLATLTNRELLVFAYNATFDPPISLTPGTLYWLEVRNDTVIPSGNECIWSWMTLAATTFNDYSAIGSLSGYSDGSARVSDFAWCLDVNFQSPDAPERACCTCAGGCDTTTKRQCENEGGSWQIDAVCPDCPVLPALNDNCVEVVDAGFPFVTDGTILFDNNCTSTDGPNPTPSEISASGETLTTDVWFKYEASCDGQLTISTCPTGSAAGGGLDSMIAVYSVGDCNAPTCPTLSDHIGRLWPSGTGWDENCNGILDGGGAYAQGPVDEGECFLIRVGGFGGQGSETGQGILTIECGAGAAVPDPAPPTDTAGRSRYVAAQIPTSLVASGAKSAIKVCVETMKTCTGGTRAGRLCVDSSDCGGGGSCDPASQEGECWWAGPSESMANAPAPPLTGAELFCEASPSHAEEWPSGDIYFFGEVVVPSSEYSVHNCAPDGSSCAQQPVIRPTGIWGNVVAPMNIVDFGDISAAVAKFSGAASAPTLVAADMVGASATPALVNRSINFADISAIIGAFAGAPYPHPIPSCP